jgi:Bacterial Ig-like domain (group 3)
MSPILQKWVFNKSCTSEQRQRIHLRLEELERRELLSVSPVGSEFQVNQTTTNSQGLGFGQHQAVAVDATGDFVVTWTDYTPTNEEVFARLYNAGGTPRTDEFRVGSFATDLQESPSVAMDAAGDFVIAWGGTSQGTLGIYAQRYNAAGVAQSAEFLVNTVPLAANNSPSVAMDSAGDFVIAWDNYAEDGSVFGIFAQHYNAAGVAQGGEFRVNSFTTGEQTQPNVGMDAEGDFVIAWGSYGEDGSKYGIYAQRYNAAGVAQGGEFPVNSFTTNSQSNPSVAMDSTGDFVIAWQSYGEDGSKYGIYAQRYNAAGVAQGGEFPVNSFTTNSQSNPSVAMDSAGDFVIAWNSSGQDGNNYGVYAQAYNAAGVAVGKEFPVNSFTTNAQNNPSVAMDSTGDFVVAWESYDQDGSNYGIYSQRFHLSTKNSPPVGTSNTVTTLEDTPYTFAVADFGFSDPNDTPPNNFLAVEITTLPTNGTLTDNGVAVTAGQFVSVTDIMSGKLIFSPVTLASGAPYASFSFQVQDDGGTANGGIDTDPTPKKMTIDVTRDMLPPMVSITSGPLATTTDTTATFTFTGSDNDTPTAELVFQTSLDGATFTQATSPVTLTGLAVGPHSFEVRDVDLDGNISAIASFSWTVKPLAPTLVTLVAPTTPVPPGQGVVFQASVTDPDGTEGTPTGSVSFLDNGNVVDTVSVVNGTATSDPITLTVGPHSLTAVYTPTGPFLASTSAALTVHAEVVGPQVSFDPSTGLWYLRNELGNGSPDGGSFAFGLPGWIPVIGDWNGDGIATIGVVDPSTGTWYLRNEDSPGAPDGGIFQYGLPGWIPVVGDWTGSGKTGIGMYDPTTAMWYLRNQPSAGAPDVTPFAYGATGWIPVTGDWDGNGTTTIGVWNPTTAIWYLRNSDSPGAPDVTPFAYGFVTYQPVTGDWTGNGATTIGVVDPRGNWFLRAENNNGVPDAANFAYGLGSWTPQVNGFIDGVSNPLHAAKRIGILDLLFSGAG